MEAVDLKRRTERDREQEHRERPDQVEETRDDPVDPAAVVAGEQCEHDRDEGADQRRTESDLERVQAAVEKPYGDVVAEIVEAENALAAAAEPAWAKDLLSTF